jgi:hypothetical protein
MPIRINLLAEAQALEELRRRDPVKRAIWVGAGLVALVLIWSASLYAKGLVRRSDLGRIQSELQSHANDYQRVLDNQKQLAGINQRLGALQQLTTNRHLSGNVLQALQQTVVDDVQLMRFKTEQVYLLTKGTEARTNEKGAVLPPKPATAAERIALTLDAKDLSANPGDQVNRFKEKLAGAPCFHEVLSKTNEIGLRNLSTPQTDPETGKAFVLFTLECRYPEKVR